MWIYIFDVGIVIIMNECQDLRKLNVHMLEKSFKKEIVAIVIQINETLKIFVWAIFEIQLCVEKALNEFDKSNDFVVC